MVWRRPVELLILAAVSRMCVDLSAKRDHFGVVYPQVGRDNYRKDIHLFYLVYCGGDRFSVKG